MAKPKLVMELTDKEIKKALDTTWGPGYNWKIRKIIRDKKAQAIIVFYRVTSEKDGATEYRVKGLSSNAGWDYVTRIKF